MKQNYHFVTSGMREFNEKVFEAFPVLKTERLTLRDFRPSDAELVFAMRGNKRNNTFIPRPEMAEISQSQELVDKVIKAYEEKQMICWAGILRDGTTSIGTVGFNMIDRPNLRAEIGGELAIEYWGKGIAQEAVHAILGFGFEEMGLHTIEAKVAPGNRGAVFILEQMGFQKEAHFKDRVYHRGSFSDMAVYTLFGEAWKAQNAPKKA